jgi:SAM-dependent methyltransferase
MPDASSSPLDEVNREIWKRDVELFALEGWSDPGELQAFLFVADSARGVPILDIGVGAGRTVPLLRLLSRDYVAVDYTPEMVELCHRRHPSVDVRLGDARDLSEIADETVGLVVFSVNGIDAVDHDDRQRVLASVRRVLRPDGQFLFSTLNKDGPLYGADPRSAPELAWEPGSLLPRQPKPPGAADGGDDSFTAVRNWRRLRGSTVDAGDWGVAPFAAHQFGLLTHFITLEGQRQELDAHGMDIDAVFSCDGEHITDLRSSAMYVNIVARRR